MHAGSVVPRRMQLTLTDDHTRQSLVFMSQF